MGDVAFNSNPSQQFYGLFPSALASAVQNGTGSTADRMYLMGQNEQATRAYQQALREAQLAELQMNHDHDQAEISKTYLTAAPGLVEHGVGGAIQPRDSSYLRLDPRQIAEADAQHLDETAAHALQMRGDFEKNDTAASGVVTPDPVRRSWIAGSTGNPADVPYLPKTQPTEGQTNAVNAEAHMIQAQAAAVAAKNHGTYSNGDVTTTNYIVNPKTGERIPLSEQTKSKPHGAQAADTQGKPNRRPPPKLDANGKVIP
jgi:hypothetical protein